MNCKISITRVLYQAPTGKPFAIVKADCTEPPLGEIIIKGNWSVIGGDFQVELQEVVDKKYGKQYILKSYKALKGNCGELVGIEAFLCVIKGVGPQTAKKIVKAFGYDTVQTLDNPDKKELKRLLKAAGISKGQKLIEGWEKNRKILTPMSFLLANGLSPNRARVLIDTYGDDVERKVKEDPYALADEMLGVGFKTADRIAMAMGMDKDSPMRAKAAVRYLIKEGAEQNGHLFLRKEDILKGLLGELNVELVVPLDNLLRDLVEAEKVVVEDEAVYDARNYKREAETAEFVDGMLKAKKLKGLEKFNSLEVNLSGYSEEQVTALQGAEKSPLYIITGLPGTGKTTCLKTLVDMFERGGLKTILCAPTGKASKRLSQATGRPAGTIHRCLGATKWGFMHNKNNPLLCDAVIADEASMIDSYLFYCLISALPYGCRLILVGDTAQLPPVGAGRPLLDLIDSGRVGVTALKKIFRQAAESNIVLNAHAVNNGNGNLKEGPDFIFIDTDDNSQALRTIEQIFHNAKSSDIEITCLSPMHKGDIGVEALNELIQSVMNPPALDKPEVRYAGALWRCGDRVMQIKNNYDKGNGGVFNGEEGYIIDIDREGPSIQVDFGDFICDYDGLGIYELKHSSCKSIHKSQGSEYDNVVIVMSTSHYIMLQRNLLYTAITRAAKKCIIVGSRKAVHMAAAKLVIEHRNTRLAQRIATDKPSPTVLLREGHKEQRDLFL